MNPQLTAAYSGISQQWANELIKERMPDVAMQVIDTALVYDENNRELLYTKGLAYESMKQYDKAREYQQRYYAISTNPSTIVTTVCDEIPLTTFCVFEVFKSPIFNNPFFPNNPW